MNKLNKKNLVLISVWAFLLMLICNVFRDFHKIEIPPMWDNLAYQIEAVKLARSFFEGDTSILQSYFGDNIPVAYIFSLALSYALNGFVSSSPYIISGIFGLGILVLTYLILLELKVNRSLAFFSCILISTLPNFIFFNFLQTRNDYPLGFFVILYLYLIILAEKSKSTRLFFLAGIVSGIGTLFKLSAPGYFFWIYLMILFLPSEGNTFKIRLKWIFISSIGALFSCGWFYLPAIHKILSYYSMWGDTAVIQLKLFTLSDRMFFYIKNFLYVHLGSKEIVGALFLFLLIGIILKIILEHRQFKLFELKNIFRSRYILVLIGSYFFIIFFMTMNRTYAVVGDIPIVQFVFILLIAFIDYLTRNFRFKSSIYLIFFLVFFPVSLTSSIRTISKEKLYERSEFTLFADKIREFRNARGLEGSKVLQVFSHPVYNTLAVSWYFHLKNQVSLKDSINIDSIDWGNLSTFKNANDIANIIKKYQFIILSDDNPLSHGGEYFLQINIFNEEIKKIILESDLYTCGENFLIGKTKFPLRFCIKKNYQYFQFANQTSDHWLEWGATATYYSLKNVKLKINAMPVRDLKYFYLEDSVTREKFSAKFTAAHIHAMYDYEIHIPASVQPRKLKLFTKPEQMIPVSEKDTRRLALMNLSAVLENE